MTTTFAASRRRLTRVTIGVCAGSVLAMTLAPAAPVLASAAAAPTAQLAPNSSEADALRAEIKALTAQKTQTGANVPEIDARLAKLRARLAKIEGTRKAAAAPDSATTGTAAQNRGVATKTTISGDELRSAQAQNTYDVIKNVPGVAQADAKGGGASDNLQIRGIHLGSTAGYRLDGGLPIVNNVILSTEDKDQVQVLKGAGALEYGLASPAGIVNYVLKRATKKPVNSFSLSTNEFGQRIAAIDLGRKFGYADRFGVRLNLAGGDTGSYVVGAGGTRWLGTMTADYTTKKARVRLAYEKFGINVVENSTLLQNKPDSTGHITLPNIPDPTHLLSGVWARDVGGGQNVQLRTDYHLNDAVSLQGELGRSDSGRAKRDVTQIGNYNVATGKGTETVTFVEDQRYINTYANVEAAIRSSYATWLENELDVGVTHNERVANNPQTSSVTYKQYIYAPVTLPAPPFPTGPIAYLPQESDDHDYFFRDSIVLERVWHLTGGLRQINYTANDQLASGKTTKTRTAFLAPALGGTVDLSKTVALYGSYVKSLEETGSAPINAANAFTILPPGPATQKEVGTRISGANGLAATLGYFTIVRSNATVDPITNIYALNGTNRFEGVESMLNARLASRLSLTVGGQMMNARQVSPDDPTINGKIPENIPKYSGNVGLTYQLPAVPGLRLSGGLQYIGVREINPQDQGVLPGATTTNFGLSYTGRISHDRVSLNLNCRNCSDKRYWSSAVNGALGVAAPRMVSLTARIDGL